jgi:hypothetical protein
MSTVGKLISAVSGLILCIGSVLRIGGRHVECGTVQASLAACYHLLEAVRD